MGIAMFLKLLALFFGAIIIIGIIRSAQREAMPPGERQRELLSKQLGHLNPTMVCPHCQEKGSVRTKTVDRKKGVSGGKAVAALFTGGVSMLATGLSRKEHLTQAYCGNCHNTWDF